MPNDTLNLYFNPIQKCGAWKIVKLPIVASVAMVAGAAVSNNQDGTHVLCSATTQNFAGILLEDIVAGDSDYATSRKLKSVAVPLRHDSEAEFKVGAGTFTGAADEGKAVKFNDSKGLAVDTAGTDGAAHAVITKYLSATRGRCRFLLDFGSIDVA